MGGFAPGKLKSRRGSHSSPRRLHRFRLSAGIQELTATNNFINFVGLPTLSPPSSRGGLAHCGPPPCSTLSPPPTGFLPGLRNGMAIRHPARATLHHPSGGVQPCRSTAPPFMD